MGGIPETVDVSKATRFTAYLGQRRVFPDVKVDSCFFNNPNRVESPNLVLQRCLLPNKKHFQRPDGMELVVDLAIGLRTFWCLLESLLAWGTLRDPLDRG